MADIFVRRSKNTGSLLTLSKNTGAGTLAILKQGGGSAVRLTKNPDKASQTYKIVKN